MKYKLGASLGETCAVFLIISAIVFLLVIPQAKSNKKKSLPDELAARKNDVLGREFKLHGQAYVIVNLADDRCLTGVNAAGAAVEFDVWVVEQLIADQKPVE